MSKCRFTCSIVVSAGLLFRSRSANWPVSHAEGLPVVFVAYQTAKDKSTMQHKNTPY